MTDASATAAQTSSTDAAADARVLRNFVGGEWVDAVPTAAQLDDIDPATGRLLARWEDSIDGDLHPTATTRSSSTRARR